jgi:hypothetical protein
MHIIRLKLRPFYLLEQSSRYFQLHLPMIHACKGTAFFPAFCKTRIVGMNNLQAFNNV